jgi:ABC-type nickel/cobalt efflux system permease component RcnA
VPPLAHTGHWIVQLVFFVPVIAFGLWMAWFLVRDLREAAREAAELPPEREDAA